MHLRRALLLFAIVLGLAAIATAVSSPMDESPSEEAAEAPSRTPTVSAGDAVTAPPAVEIRFDADLDQTRRIEAGQPATVLVEAAEAGQVTIPSLGLGGSAEPLTPARFDVLATQPGRHEIRFTPASSDETDAAGSLVVEPVEE